MSPIGTRAVHRPFAHMLAAPATAPRASASSMTPMLRVDLHRARLHGHRPRLLGRTRMPVDDERLQPPPRELVCQHQPRRTGADDEDVNFLAHVSCGCIGHGKTF